MSRRAVLVLLPSLLLVGCSSGQPEPAQLSPSAALTPDTSASASGSGASCVVDGYGVERESLPVDLGTSGLACEQALAVLAAYSALVAADDGTHGNTANYVVDGWACSTPSAGVGVTQGVAGVCSQDGKELRVLTAS